MSYHPRIESTKIATFQTTRTRCSELWFVNNSGLEGAILGYAAKYATRYSVKLYALSIEGNHIQFPAHFPKANRAHFMRDFNSSVARAVPRYQRSHPTGKFWARRYSAEYLPGDEDIEEQFFYTVLQPVNDGLVDSIYDYPAYNCFEDAIYGRRRKFKVIRWKEYHDALRWNKSLKPDDFAEVVELQYERLPGYQDLTTEEYASQMRRKLIARTARVIQNRKAKNSAGEDMLAKTIPGSKPKSTKTSNSTTSRPRVLSKDFQRRTRGEAWYYDTIFEHKESSIRYRAGELDVKFPPGTYKPPIFTVASQQAILE